MTEPAPMPKASGSVLPTPSRWPTAGTCGLGLAEAMEKTVTRHRADVRLPDEDAGERVHDLSRMVDRGEARG